MQNSSHQMSKTLPRVVHDIECGYCGKHVTWAGVKSNYIYKKYYKGDGLLYFCSERCKVDYIKAHQEQVKRRRKERKKNNGK